VHEVLVGDDPDSCGVEVELEDLDRSSQSREGPAQGVGELAKGDPPEDVMTNDRVLRLPTGEMIRIARTGDDSGGAVFEFEAVLPPRLTGPPAHKHRTETETFEVVEGTLRVRVGQDSRELGPGESVTVPPGTVHAFSNPADTPVRLITRETPAGQLEPQFRALASAGRLPPLLSMAQINVDHDLSFVLHGVPEVPQRLLWQALAALNRFRSRFS